jgi:hypothetical protein
MTTFNINIDHELARSAAFFDNFAADRLFDIERAFIDFGATEEELENMLESQRALIASERQRYLAHLEAWFRRDCEQLH